MKWVVVAIYIDDTLSDPEQVILFRIKWNYSKRKKRVGTER